MWFTRGIAAEGGGARLGSISVSRRGGQLHFQPQRRLLININTQASSLSVCREFIVPATRQPLCKYWRMVDFMGGLWFRERGWKGGSLLVYTRKICRFFLSFSIKRLKCFRIFPLFLLNQTKLRTNIRYSKEGSFLQEIIISIIFLVLYIFDFFLQHGFTDYKGSNESKLNFNALKFVKETHRQEMKGTAIDEPLEEYSSRAPSLNLATLFLLIHATPLLWNGNNGDV